MNTKVKRISIISMIFIYILLVFIFFFLFKNSFLKYLEFINCCFVLIMSIISIWLLGYRKNQFNRLKLSILFITFIVVLMYFTLSYGFGLINGYLRNSFALAPIDIFNNSIYVILTIIFSEILRYVIINSDRESNNNIILITVIMSLIEYSNCFNIYNYNSVLELLKFVSLCFIPIVVKNTTLSYLCKYGGFYPCIVYRLLIECFIYFVPIVPNLSDFMDAALLIILPFFIYISNSRMINEHLYGIEHEFTDTAFKVWDIPIIGALVILVIIISGMSPIYMVGVASASMEPELNIGDAVILRKVKDDDEYRVGDVIAFNKGGKMIVHRIVDILENDGEKYYDTQGDNNNSDDGIYLGIDEIDGVYLFKIPYIAKLSVWFNERIGG